MASTAVAAYGTILRYIGPPEVPIGELTNISGLSLGADTIDVTNHDSTSAVREFVAGLIDPGEVSFEANWIPANTGQQTLKTHLLARDKRSMVINMPDGSEWQFTAACTGLSIADAAVEGKLMMNGTLKVSGVPTLATAYSTGLTTPFFSLTGADTGAISPSPAAANATYAYTAALANADTTLVVTPTATAGVIQVGKTSATMATVATGQDSSALAMSVGANSVYITVQETSKKWRLYTIVATRAAE